MIAVVIVALLVCFAIAAWCALESWRDNNNLRRRLEEIESRKESSSRNAAR